MTHTHTRGIAVSTGSVLARAALGGWCERGHLGGEVSVEEALAVQVAESPGDVQRQAQAHAPRQVHLAAQQLLQVTAVDVLMTSTQEGTVKTDSLTKISTHHNKVQPYCLQTTYSKLKLLVRNPFILVFICFGN